MKLKMPKLGNTVNTCLLSKWYVDEGEKINKGQRLFSYETDKTQVDYLSEVDGILERKLFFENDEVNVFETIAIINTDEGINQSESRNENHFSPRARKLVEYLQIDVPSEVKGSGVNKRIIEKDIINLSNNINTYEIDKININNNKTNNLENIENTNLNIQKFSNVRKVIKRNLTNSLNSTSQSTLSAEVNMKKILELKENINNNIDGKVTLNDFFTFAVAKFIHPNSIVNATSTEDGFILNETINLGIAIDRNKGLYVPNIKNANKKSLMELSVETKELIQMVEKNELKPEYFKNGTISITNVGNTKIRMFTPILNYPEVTIIGIGGLYYDLDFVETNIVKVPKIMISLTFDHNIYDGSLAARFLTKFINALENYELLFVN